MTISPRIISSRKPLFWIVFSLLSLAGIAFTVKFFTRAFPIANVDIKIDRSQALTQARGLAERFGWGPAGYHQSAAFDVDNEVQNYVELEAGGSTAFNEMIKGTLYSPYTWRVRHFKEAEPNETTAIFKPDGTAYGFVEKIAEATPGAALHGVEARNLAEQATKAWGIELNEYAIIESSQEVRQNGRIDHTFVYERPVLIGEGRYRLKLVVTGDKLTELSHFIKIPEGFALRYNNMRSANKVISTIARLAMFILYIVLGCCLGLFLLLRQRWVLWHTALLWALFLGLLQALNAFNTLPLAWMSYNTSMSSQTFLLAYVSGIITSFLYMFFLYGLSITAAESLSRKAFGNHIQLWSAWTSPAANSLSVLGRTIGGYLVVGFDLALVVATYFVTRSYFGWWTPSDPLVDPNVLASYVPWFSSAAQALNAGFWEECLFRAIPLSCAALLGQYVGRRNLGIALGMIAQAFIFGGAHALYATQPAYARLLELIVPSFIFGGIYLVYGLLPGIISHFMYDLVLMSLPLFISSAPGAWINQGAVIGWGLIPLLIVVYVRWRQGAWQNIPAALYNAAWKPTAATTEQPRIPLSLPVTVFKTQRVVGIMFGGLVAWALLTQFHQDAPALRITRNQAIEKANHVLKERGIALNRSWTTLAATAGQQDADSRFVWQKSGRAEYQRLLEQAYITPPVWLVRYAQFEGDLEERAEEYRVLVAGNGTVIRFTHAIPEKRAGAALKEKEARALAHTVLQDLHIDPAQVEEISAVPTKRPARTDWAITVAYPTMYQAADGQARITITISGDEVVDVNRFIHVPEVWKREDLNRQTLLATLQALSGFMLVLVIIAVALYAFFSAGFAGRFVLACTGLLVLFSTIMLFNGLPGVSIYFHASDPLSSQFFRTIAGLFLQTAVLSAVYALIFGFAQSQKNGVVHITYAKRFTACLAGVALAVIASFIKFSGPSLSPTWASYASASSYIPLLNTSLEFVIAFVFACSILFALILAINMLTDHGTRQQYAVIACMFIAGIGFAATGMDSLVWWGVKGTLIGAVLTAMYYLLLRSEPVFIIPMLATAHILRVIHTLTFNAYPGAAVGCVIGIVAIVGLGRWLFEAIRK